MKTFSATLRKLLSDEKVKLCEHDQDGCWVYLKSGWNNGDGGEHCIHEDTWKACWEKFGFVRKCECRECTLDAAASSR